MKFTNPGALFVALFLVLTNSVSTHAEPESPTFSDFIPVLFDRGMPGRDGPFDLSSSTDAKLAAEALQEDLALLEARPGKISLIGSTDDDECEQMECLYLSVRRIAIVKEWLIERGVPKSRFNPPIVLGSDFPSSENSSADGRRRNRRAELSFSK